jgi:hypothetical protein
MSAYNLVNMLSGSGLNGGIYDTRTRDKVLDIRIGNSMGSEAPAAGKFWFLLNDWVIIKGRYVTWKMY